jgi:carbon-monoxide dehydrogenase medium subunit
VIRSEDVVSHGLPLAQACWEIGSPQLRNRATVVGNLVTASPANDTISALMALDAELTMSNVHRTRSVKLVDFYTGVRKSVLEPDELVTEVAFPIPDKTSRGVFVKLGLRRAQAISVVHLACLLDFNGDQVRAARIVLGSVGPVVKNVDEASHSLEGKPLTDESIQDAVQQAMASITPIDDIRATADYRRVTTGVMVRRALQALRHSKERDNWPSRPVTLSTPVPNTARTEVALAQRISAVVNGSQVETARATSKTLLDWLRDDAGPALAKPLTGTKEGCAEGECGACTVYLDGEAVMACLVPAPRADGSEIVTIEGLSNGEGTLHPLQKAFVDHGAVQCGFCTPGLVLAGAKLLEEQTSPTTDEIRIALSGNLCRCTGYYKIIDSVMAASEQRGNNG